MPDAGDTPAAEPRDLDAVRAEAIRWLAPSVQHELSNSLGAIQLFADELARDPRLPQELRDSARLLDAETRRTRGIVTTLLEVARDRPPVLAPVAIDQLLDEVLDLLAWFRVDVAIERVTAAGLPPVDSDPSRLRQLLVVLLVDALRGLRRATARRLGADRRDADHGPGRRGAEVAYRRADGAPAADETALLPSGDRPLDGVGGTLRVERDDAGGRLLLALPIAATAPAEASRADASAPAQRCRGPRPSSSATTRTRSARCSSGSSSATGCASSTRPTGPPRSRSSRRPRWMRCSPTSTWPA